MSEELKPNLEPAGLSREQVLQWTFLLDVLNFCFWGDVDKKEDGLFAFNYQGVTWTGYRSMRAALCKAVEEDHIPIYSPLYYRNITLNQLKMIFKSETSVELPLLKERVENLREAAAVLEEVCVNSCVTTSYVQLLCISCHAYYRLCVCVFVRPK